MVKVLDRVIHNVSAPNRDIDRINWLMFHRVGWADPREWESRGFTIDAAGVRKFYETNPEAAKATGGKMPYTFTIDPSGVIEQSWPLGETAWHARRFSIEAIGVALLGDFRIQPPTENALWSAAELTALLTTFWTQLDPVGHSEIQGAVAPGKVCPGHLLDMDRLRQLAVDIRKATTGHRMMEAGITW